MSLYTYLSILVAGGAAVKESKVIVKFLSALSAASILLNASSLLSFAGSSGDEYKESSSSNSKTEYLVAAMSGRGQQSDPVGDLFKLKLIEEMEKKEKDEEKEKEKPKKGSFKWMMGKVHDGVEDVLDGFPLIFVGLIGVGVVCKNKDAISGFVSEGIGLIRGYKLAIDPEMESKIRKNEAEAEKAEIENKYSDNVVYRVFKDIIGAAGSVLGINKK